MNVTIRLDCPRARSFIRHLNTHVLKDVFRSTETLQFVHFQKLSEIFHIFLREKLPSNVNLSEPFGQHELKIIVLPSLPLKSNRQVEISNIKRYQSMSDCFWKVFGLQLILPYL